MLHMKQWSQRTPTVGGGTGALYSMAEILAKPPVGSLPWHARTGIGRRCRPVFPLSASRRLRCPQAPVVSHHAPISF